MTRVAFISDLHLEYRKQLVWPILDGQIGPLKDIGFPSRLDADLLVIAGDVHPNPAICRALRNAASRYYDIPVIMVAGNHDCYDRPFPENELVTVAEVAGLRVAGTTLWTHLDPLAQALIGEFSDFRNIQGITPEMWNRTHANQLAALQQTGADLIVTHHAPSMGSIHQHYAGNPKNAFYASSVDLSAFPAKLWIHGHVHHRHDYVEAGTRVVCNPVGYPFEKHHTQAIQVVEI